MSRLVSVATGFFLTDTTWGVVSGDGVVDSEAASTAISTSALTTPSFTAGGGDTINGVALKLSARAASPSGTFTVTLRNVTLSLDLTSVTVNVSDLPSSGNGWQYFKFSSGQPIDPVTDYAVKVVCSATGSQVTLFRSSTTNDFSKLLVTDQNQYVAAGDQLLICGELTGAGTGNSFTVTMDNSDTTIFGATSYTDGVSVNNRGTLAYSTDGMVNYHLKYAGRFSVYGGGTFNIGTSGDRVPSGWTATLEMSVSTNVDTGLVIQNGGTFNAYGQTITAYQTLLNTDEAAAATVLGVVSTSGWANGDEIAIASTTRTASQHEKRTISTVDSATQVTVTSGLTNAHSGTSPTQAEVIHLTRNVKILGTSATLQGYVWFDDTSTVVCDSVQFKWMGSGTTNKRGVDIQTTTGNCTITGCSFHEFSVSSSTGVFVSGSTSNNIAISNCVIWGIAAKGIDVSAATTGASISITNIFAVGADVGFNILDLGITLTGCAAPSCTSNGFVIGEAGARTNSFDNLSTHSCGSTSFLLGNNKEGLFTNITSWRSSGSGFGINGASSSDPVIDGLTVFGNTTNNVLIAAGYSATFRNIVASGDTSFSTTSGISCSVNSRVVVENSTFGVATGIKTAHTQDVLLSNNGPFVFRDCLFESATEISITATVQGNLGGVFSQRHDQTNGLHKRYTVYGNATTETTTFNTASPSEKLSPLSSTIKFRSSVMRVAVASGSTVTISVYVRKDTSYNGAAPRLRILANPALGINFDADATVDTFTAAADTWEQLTGTTAAAGDDGVMEFVVDVDGSAGAVFVDDWSVS